MNGPLLTAYALSDSTDLLFAVLVGFGFGFVLERAGFGSADRLTAIFYGRDFRVMRVMFTAVVTTMLGLYGLDLAGVMPLGELAVLPTYLWPQLVAGLFLGAGFIVGGYCPGTAFVGAASGKVDALFFIGGLAVGSLGFAVVSPDLQAWHVSGSMDRVLLHEVLGVPAGVAVLGVVAFALGCFWAVGHVQRWVRRTWDLPELEPERFSWLPHRLAAGALAAAGVLYLGVSTGTGHLATARPLPELRLAASDAGLDVWQALALRAEFGSALTVLDLRPAERFEAYALPDSRNLPGLRDAASIAREAGPNARAVLLVGEDEAALASLVAGARGELRLHYLRGGPRAFYVAVELPTPLFSDQPVPLEYPESLRLVRGWLKQPPGALSEASSASLKMALRRLAAAGLAPTALASGSPAASPAGAPKKRLSGGCGG